MDQPTVHFLYASQTGNSESIASMLHNQCAAHNITAGALMTLDEAVRKNFFVPPEGAAPTIPSLTVVIVTSTHGDGDFPDNGQRFKRYVKTTKESLAHVRYTVLALGDTNYTNFCAAGKFADIQMEERGATRFYSRGEADDGVSLELVVDPWSTGLWEKIRDVEAYVEPITGRDAPAPVGPLDAFHNTPPCVVIVYSPGAAQHLALMMFEYIVNDDIAVEMVPSRSFRPNRLARPATVAIFLRDHAVPADAVFEVFDAVRTPDAKSELRETLTAWLKTLARAVSLDFVRTEAEVFSTQDALRTLGITPLIPLDKKPVRHCTFAHANGNPADTSAWCLAILGHLPALKKNADFAQVVASWMENWAFRGSIDSERVMSQGAGRAATAGKKQATTIVDNFLKPVVFLHGGDTPIAAEIAYELSKMAEKQGLGCAVAPANNYKSVAFPRQASFVFIVSGSSSLRSSTDRLQKFLKGVAAKGEKLDKARFAILGIDDRGVSEHFNAAALELELHLIEAGATQVHPTGLADHAAAQGIDTVLALWTRGLWRALETGIEAKGGYIDATSSKSFGQPHAASQQAGGSGGGTNIPTFASQRTASAVWFPWEEVPLCEEAVGRTRLVFMYSSSGMAKATAKRGANVARAKGFPVTVRALDRYDDLSLAQIDNLIIVVDTGADGRLAGGKRFKKFVRSKANSPDMLARLRFAILGIGGDRDAHPAHELSAALFGLGATRVFPVGLMASIVDVESYAEPWMRGVWGVMSNLAKTDERSPSPQGGPGDLGGAFPPATSAAAAAAAATSGLASATSILFLYGSVTGNSEAIAKDLHREALHRGLHSRVAALNYFQSMKFNTTQFVVIVCCSTNTHSGFPYNAAKFVKYIMSKSLPADHLTKVQFSVLALGNSRYGERFCVAGRTLDARLEALGGTRFLAAGLADEVEGLEVTVERWRKQLFTTVCATPRQTPQLSFMLASDSAVAAAAGLPSLEALTTGGVVGDDSGRSGGGPLGGLASGVSNSGSVLIMFGSQQGNAEAIAHTLHQKLVAIGVPKLAIGPLNDFNKLQWRTHRTIVIVCSTTGDGEFPDNAQQFWKFVKQKSHPDDLLAGQRYAVLALGDTNYSRFCQAGRGLDRRLEELGAVRFFARADADDAFDLSAVADPWMDAVAAALEPKDLQSFGGSSAGRRGDENTSSGAHLNNSGNAAGEAAETASVDSSQQRGLSTASSNGATPGAGRASAGATAAAAAALAMGDGGEPNSAPFPVRIKCWQPMTSGDNVTEVVHLTFEVPVGTTWNPGDAIGVMPVNDDASVEYLLERLNVRGDDPFLPPLSLGVDSAFPGAPLYSRLPFPSVTNRVVLQRYVCLRIHNKNVVQLILNCTSDAVEQAILTSWFQHQSKEWVQKLREKVTIVDLLRQFPHSRPLFRHVVEYLMVLQPRYYSIASAHSADPRSLSIAFRMVHRGTCTTWLRRLCEAQARGHDADINIFLRKSAEFKMPADPKIPLILIGPGTGVAPFISFLEHREVYHRQNPQALLGETHLFFGCRHRESDFLFADKLQQLETARVIHSLHLAFSQESNDGLWYGGCYVQDKIQECSNHLCHLILNCNAHVYVCGDAESMARDVHRILIDVLEEYKGCGYQESARYLDAMLNDGRYQRDIWS